MSAFDVQALRNQYAPLRTARNGRIPVFLDGPGGTQVPDRVIDAMSHYLRTCNSNQCGAFATSRESDAILTDAHQAVADLLNAPSADEIIFGQNMTSLTFHLSRAIARVLKPSDEVVVTRLDHDANITPWLLAARDAGAQVRWVDIRPEDCTLDMDDLRRQLSERTKLVAVGAASNLVGTRNDISTITRLAKDCGAWMFVDAVHFAPHAPIDVQAWGCDFLSCSAYKFFGPHVGILWGRRELLEELPAYKVRPASNKLPYRWMTGTQNHEGIAGVAAAIDYIADLAGENADRREALHATLAAIQEYETELCRRLLAGLAQRSQFRVWGVSDVDALSSRVPTISITHESKTPRQVVEHLAVREIYAWAGHMYAITLTERLGVEEKGGLVRLGLVHYNTADEVDYLLSCLDEL